MPLKLKLINLAERKFRKASFGFFTQPPICQAFLAAMIPKGLDIDVEIIDACHLKGLDVHETQKRIRKELGDPDFKIQQRARGRLQYLGAEAFDALVQAERHLPEPDRHYWRAGRMDLQAGRWTRSLGNMRQPVALYFAPDLGCPGFAAGVRIHGAVFIDSPCDQPGGAPMDLDIYGVLVVNGNLYSGNANLRINHIQVAAARETKLRFPVLRTVSVPGSWKDF